MVFKGTSDNAKTVLCTRFQSAEGCRFGDRCNFAHGDDEIRSRPDGGGVLRFQGDAAFSRGAPPNQFAGRGNWGASGDAHGATQYSGGNAHWAAQGNGGGWPGGGGGGAGAQSGVMGGAVAALLGSSHPEAPALALRNLEPGNHGWTQHTAPEGYCYYYNSHTGVSQWERPLALDFPISSQP